MYRKRNNKWMSDKDDKDRAIRILTKYVESYESGVLLAHDFYVLSKVYVKEMERKEHGKTESNS